MRFLQLLKPNRAPSEAPRVADSPTMPAAPADEASQAGQGGSALAEAERLVEAGRLTEAVDRLAEADRSRRDAAVEVRLLELRRQAAEAFEAGPGRDEWPPAYLDPFPGLSGRPPEVDGCDLDTDILGGAVAHHGCLVVRRAFDERCVARTVAAIDRARAGWQSATDGLGPSDEWYRPLHVSPAKKNQVLRNMVAEQGGLWLGDSPAGAAQVLADLGAAGIIPAIAGHFGERPFISLQKSTMRRSIPKYKLAAWHQDGSFLTPGVRTMNAWVALSTCGGDSPAPGLEIIPRRFDEVFPVDEVLSPHSISFDLIAELAAATPTLLPAFEPGDALLFDERLVHRTHLTQDMTEVRYAIECWFFAPSHHSTSYAPLLV